MNLSQIFLKILLEKSPKKHPKKLIWTSGAISSRRWGNGAALRGGNGAAPRRDGAAACGLQHHVTWPSSPYVTVGRPGMGHVPKRSLPEVGGENPRENGEKHQKDSEKYGDWTSWNMTSLEGIWRTRTVNLAFEKQMIILWGDNLWFIDQGNY